mmetsp:Transcript_13616/g.55128  ORF Transcript_13616/g.55128 Transcript_13616/m.55128 type:complete len:235 (+) Transcript_13616:665-1369(+)
MRRGGCRFRASRGLRRRGGADDVEGSRGAQDAEAGEEGSGPARGAGTGRRRRRRVPCRRRRRPPPAEAARARRASRRRRRVTTPRRWNPRRRRPSRTKPRHPVRSSARRNRRARLEGRNPRRRNPRRFDPRRRTRSFWAPRPGRSFRRRAQTPPPSARTCPRSPVRAPAPSPPTSTWSPWRRPLGVVKAEIREVRSPLGRTRSPTLWRLHRFRTVRSAISRCPPRELLPPSRSP